MDKIQYSLSNLFMTYNYFITLNPKQLKQILAGALAPVISRITQSCNNSGDHLWELRFQSFI
jgi:REP element-mobilizing transposase RayT